MSAVDGVTWSAFLLQHGKNYTSFDYDIRVGSGVIAELPLPDKYLKDYQQLTQKRIDAIGYQTAGINIFEVKQRAGLSALGQLSAYSMLYLRSHPRALILSLNLVCSFITKEELEIYQAKAIRVFVYPEQ